MKKIAIVNNKGGVGKTTTAVNVGACLASLGKKVLLIDLDGQANLTQSLGMMGKGNGVYQLMKEKGKVEPLQVFDNLYILSASEQLTELEQELVTEFDRERLLRYGLEAYENTFDFAIMDCAPSKGLLTVNALTACDDILIPLQAEYLAMQGVKSLTELVFRVKRSLNPALRILGVAITMFDKRKVLNNSVANEISQHYPIFSTYIRENVALAEAPTARVDIYRYSATSNGAEDYRLLTQEILKRYE